VYEALRDAGLAVVPVAELDRLAEVERALRLATDGLREIAAARPTRGVPLKDTLEGCNSIARAILAASGETPQETKP
jgi:hypothetical protein